MSLARDSLPDASLQKSDVIDFCNHYIEQQDHLLLLGEARPQLRSVVSIAGVPNHALGSLLRVCPHCLCLPGSTLGIVGMPAGTAWYCVSDLVVLDTSAKLLGSVNVEVEDGDQRPTLCVTIATTPNAINAGSSYMAGNSRQRLQYMSVFIWFATSLCATIRAETQTQ